MSPLGNAIAYSCLAIFVALGLALIFFEALLAGVALCVILHGPLLSLADGRVTLLDPPGWWALLWISLGAGILLCLMTIPSVGEITRPVVAVVFSFAVAGFCEAALAARLATLWPPLAAVAYVALALGVLVVVAPLHLIARAGVTHFLKMHPESWH